MTARTSTIPFVGGATMTRHLPQQTVEPASGRTQLLVLDPRDPMAIARQLLTAKFTIDEKQGLYRYRDEFFKFAGSSYRPVDDASIRSEIWSFLEGAYKAEAGSYSPFMPKKGIVDNVVDALQAVCNLDRAVETPTWLDKTQDRPPAAEFLPVANGLLHLPTGDLHPPSPLYFGLGSSDVQFHANAPEPHDWLKFLDDLFGDDRESIDLLQDMMGYGLGSDTSQQKIMLLVGPPRSGKGTIAKTLTTLVGANNVVGPTMASLGQNFGLAALIGKSVAIIGDARIGGRTDQAIIAERLLSISGEDIHTIDRKFKEPWTGRLGTRFFILTNELPRLTDNSGALANRFVVLVMKRSFLGEEDQGLQARLRPEYPGILNWALTGYRRLRDRGHFVQAASGLEASRDLVELASPVKAFVAEKCVLSGHVKIDDLYRALVRWCEENGQEPGAKITFGRNLHAAIAGLEITFHRHEGGRYRAYQGISLETEWRV